MRVLVIGRGAREHAMAARLAAERDCAEVICAPGNPGISAVARTVPVEQNDSAALLGLVDREQIDLTVVGPEEPLSLGVSDAFIEEGRLIVGPTAAAAGLESSKAFAKSFMERHRVATAGFRTCETFDEAIATLRSGEFGWPVVLKADGLAQGKGVVIAVGLNDAESAVTAMMKDRRFGTAGARVVIEEYLTGPEVSFFVLSDGRRALPLGTAQDHKRIFDDDRGPNTGGMGAFAPSPLMDETLSRQVMKDIIDPVIHGMADEGCPFCGFLYAGLMITAAGPKVIEFNVRFGDPEAQVVLPLLDEPLLPLLVAAASGRLQQSACRLSADKLVGVVIASRGYPESSESGKPISGIAEAEGIAGVSLLHAGTARQGKDIVTAGGRVLTVVGRGRNFDDAIKLAYQGVERISFDGMQFRRDIGRKALQATP